MVTDKNDLNKLKQLEEKKFNIWEQKMINYYKDHLKNNIQQNIKSIKLQKSINMNECINFCFKSFINFTKLSLDELIQQLHDFLANYLEEIDLGIDVLGENYDLKEEFFCKLMVKYPYEQLKLRKKEIELKNELKRDLQLNKKKF